MGLIMLILIGTVPTAYALNRAVPEKYVSEFVVNSNAAEGVLAAHGNNAPPPFDARRAVTADIADKMLKPETIPAVGALVGQIETQVTGYGSLAKVPAVATENMRNDMYLASEAMKRLCKEKASA